MVGMGWEGVAAEVAACLQASEVYQISAEELDFANDPVHGTGSTAERGQGQRHLYAICIRRSVPGST